MKHLDLADVADLARHVAKSPDRERMERHLATGCDRCRKSVTFMREVVALSQADARWEPPEGVVRLAAAIFPAELPRTVDFKRRLLARLVFDSFSQPLPAGVRSVHRRSRQVMYRAGDFYVDLRIDHEQGPRRVSLVGQIASRGEPVRLLDVFLVDGSRALARALVNEFGEFQMEYTPVPRLRLRIPLEAGELGLDVPLARLAAPTARPRGRAGKHRSP